MNRVLTVRNLKPKLMVLVLFVFTITLHANTSRKSNIKISLDLENVTMERVFFEIEKLTKLKFFYKTQDVNLNSIITIKIEEQAIDPVLIELFKDHYITFKVLRNKIILKKDKSKSHHNNQVIGKIIDKKTNKIISNCNIIIQETFKGVSSNDLGSFKLDNITSFPVKLIVSHVNYKQEVLNIKEASDIVVELELRRNNLEAVLIKSNKVSTVSQLINNRSQQVKKNGFDKYGRSTNHKKSRNSRPIFNQDNQTAATNLKTKGSGTSILDWIFCDN